MAMDRSDKTAFTILVTILAVLLSIIMWCDHATKKANLGMASSYYVKDSRTNMCFLKMRFGSYATFTCVPCSAEVEKILVSEKTYEDSKD